MKTNYLIYIAIIACLWLSACSEHEDSDKIAETISLSAVVDEVKIMSRTANDGAYTGTVPSDENNLKAEVWFSLTSGEYPDPDTPSDDTHLPIHTTINYVTGTATFPDDSKFTPKYPTNASDVYCVGFYPADNGWTGNTDFSVATHTINGKQDIMFAPQISGNWNNHFKSQHFRHLLTWLKVCVCTTSPEAGSYWGKLKDIQLRSVPQSLTIDLSKPEGSEFKLQEAVRYSTDTLDISIMNTTGEVDLEIVSKEVASVFCPPIMVKTDGKNKLKYKLYIECENGSATIDVELKALNDKEENTGESSSGPSDAELLAYPSGLQYVLTLFFHPFNVVEGVCTLNAWNAQNEDLYPNPTALNN